MHISGKHQSNKASIQRSILIISLVGSRKRNCRHLGIFLLFANGQRSTLIAAGSQLFWFCRHGHFILDQKSPFWVLQCDTKNNVLFQRWSSYYKLLCSNRPLNNLLCLWNGRKNICFSPAVRGGFSDAPTWSVPLEITSPIFFTASPMILFGSSSFLFWTELFCTTFPLWDFVPALDAVVDANLSPLDSIIESDPAFESTLVIDAASTSASFFLFWMVELKL